MWPDASRQGIPGNPAVKCIKCWGTSVILSKAKHPDTGVLFWRLTCLDCRVAWPQDQHGGNPDEYA